MLCGPIKPVKPPRQARSDFYNNLRSTPDYANWLTELSRATSIPKQTLFELGLRAISESYGHPVGPPPARVTR
jgi:hypothetical protein